MSRAYYNEIDPYCAAWLRNLIAGGHIAPGDVDQRDIRDVRPSDLAGYTQCHFFAGIGVWSAALRLAGWPDDRPVWTGSCPCQPFSAAGKGGGFDDERHLWPAWHHLIRVCRPGTVFGEQVASKDGLGWVDLVQADLEGEAYACWPVDMCAAGVGAPHIRQRLGFVAGPTLGDACALGLSLRDRGSTGQRRLESPDSGSAGGMGNGSGGGGVSRTPVVSGEIRHPDSPSGSPGRVADVHNDGSSPWRGRGSVLPEHDLEQGDHFGGVADNDDAVRRPNGPGGHLGDWNDAAREEGSGYLEGRGLAGGRPSAPDNPWGDADWLLCRDGKWRPVEPGTFPLAHGSPSRVGRLRAYGNAIVRRWAATIIATFLEAEADGFADLVGDRSLTADVMDLLG